MIKIWQSYSCNNSSSYRLVARFADTATARETAAELTEFFEAQARLEEQRRTYRYQDASLTVLARTYGFDWQDGGAGDNGDGPHVFTEGEVLIVFHAYCLGLGPGVPAFLADRDARVDKERAGHLQMSLLFRAEPGVDPGLDEELATVFSQLGGKDRRNVHPFQAPWSSTIRSTGRLTCFRDAGTVGLYFPANPEDIALVKAWLARHGIENVLMHFEEPADALLFEALATARCTACNGLLEYLDPRLCDIETPQLVCKPCGGLYELAAFVKS